MPRSVDEPPTAKSEDQDDSAVTEAALSLLFNVAAGDEPGHIMGEGADGSDIAGLIVEEAARSATALQLVERMPFLAAAYDRYGDRLASNGKAGGLPDTIRADEKARIECQATGQGLLLLANIDAEPAQTGMRRLALLIERETLNDMLDLDTSQTALTDTEFRLTCMLMAGHDLQSAARVDGVAYDTRRKQLRAVLQKMAVGSQQALVRVVMFALLDRILRHLTRPQGLGADIRFLQDSYGDDLSVHELGVRGGRLRVVEVGPKRGRPVVFVHPMLLAAMPLPEHVHLLKQRNLRALIPLRSGFHGSELGLPAKATAEARMAAYVSAVEQMMDIFGLARVPVVSLVFGAPWAVALCKHLGKRAESLHLVAAPVPPHRLPRTMGMSFVRSLGPFARRMPHAVEALVRMHSKLLGSERLMAKGLRVTYRDSQRDSEVILALTNRGWLQKWLRMTVTYSVNGVAGDLLANGIDWDLELGQLACPLYFLHGDEDRVGDIDIIAEIVALHPHATLQVQPGEGQLFYLQQPELIFRHL